MKVDKIILLALIILFFSCSKKVTIDKLNKPVYKDFKKNIKISYNEYKVYPSSTDSYREYYENDKYEVDRSIKFRNKVIDSLNLIDKEKWLLVRLNGTNYSGAYEKTFIFFDSKCVYYSLPKPDDSLNFIVKECKIEELLKQNNKDILYIYESFENGSFDKIKIEPDTNPLLRYKIIFVKNKKISSYKLNSADYILRKWH